METQPFSIDYIIYMVYMKTKTVNVFIEFYLVLSLGLVYLTQATELVQLYCESNRFACKLIWSIFLIALYIEIIIEFTKERCKVRNKFRKYCCRDKKKNESQQFKLKCFHSRYGLVALKINNEYYCGSSICTMNFGNVS